jgi:hypothetical protein
MDVRPVNPFVVANNDVHDEHDADPLVGLYVSMPHATQLDEPSVPV